MERTTQKYYSLRIVSKGQGVFHSILFAKHTFGQLFCTMYIFEATGVTVL